MLTCHCVFLYLKLVSGSQKGGQMKRKCFTEEEIIGVLRENETGAKTADPARKYGASEAMSYNWKQLEDENAKLKKLLAE